MVLSGEAQDIPDLDAAEAKVIDESSQVYIVLWLEDSEVGS